MKRIVDLSQEIYEGMPVYAGHLETKVWQHHRFEDTAPNFDSDFAYQSLGITFCDHGPTHVDALSHLDPRPDAPTIDRMDLAQFCGEGTCLDVSGVEPREYITADHLERAAAGVDLREGDVLLLRTGAVDRFGGTPEYTTQYPGLDQSAADWLRDRKPKIFGVGLAEPGQPRRPHLPRAPVQPRIRRHPLREPGESRRGRRPPVHVLRLPVANPWRPWLSGASRRDAG